MCNKNNMLLIIKSKQVMIERHTDMTALQSRQQKYEQQVIL